MRHQHENGYITNDVLKIKMEELKNLKVDYNKRLDEIREALSRNAMTEDYERSLELFSEKYARVLDNAMKNRNEAAEILNMLIDRIVVYSRPVNENDRIAGRKKDGQEIPESIEIKLKLPQELMNSVTGEFGVKNTEWWIGRDSNPRPWA